jgi:XTP/dITP diphosphohydrolase
VRGVEKAVAAERRSADVPAELDLAPIGSITEDEWRACWPADGPQPEPDPEPDESAPDEPESDEADPPA